MHISAFSVIDQVLFPAEDPNANNPPLSTADTRKYFQEIKRIRSELAGFQPIDNAPGPDAQEAASPEMMELSQNMF